MYADSESIRVGGNFVSKNNIKYCPSSLLMK